MFVEREIGDQPLQSRILVLELPHPAHLVDAQMPEPLLPDVECGLADAELPTDVGGGCPRLGLPERVRHALLGKLRPLHPLPPRVVEDCRQRHDTLVLNCRRFRGRRHSGLTTLADHEIAHACKNLFRNQMNENADAWDALGEAFHKRLERNYVTWVRRYVGQTRLLRTFTPEELRLRPVTWTIRGLTPAVAFFENVVTAHAADLRIG